MKSSSRKHFFILLILVLAVPLPGSVGESSEPLLWGVALDGYPITSDRLSAVVGSTGLVPSIVVFFQQWPRDGNLPADFPRESLAAIWERGAVPCLTWEPMCHREGREIAIPCEAITGGKYDRYLSSFAAEARRWGKPFLVRFAHEMNLDRYHWGTAKEDYGARSPELYKSMFKYVVSLVRRAGAENVLWVFCPNAESVPNPNFLPDAAWNKAGNYYPGDDFVDILGMDGYNWGTTMTEERDGWQSSWKPFREIFAPLRGELKKLAPGKPIVVFETASVNQGGDRTLWIKEALETSGAWGIRGLVWFQADKEFNWSIENEKDTSYISAVRTATSPSQNWIRRMMK